jgi:hypothetical protein
MHATLSICATTWNDYPAMPSTPETLEITLPFSDYPALGVQSLRMKRLLLAPVLRRTLQSAATANTTA